MNEFHEQAMNFCKNNNILISCEYLKTDFYFDDDTEKRDIYRIYIEKFGFDNTTIIDEYKLKFGDSLTNTKSNPKKYYNGHNQEDLAYSVLTSITKYEPGTFNDFCNDYGYDSDSRKAKKLYEEVHKEWKAVARIFHDCLDELRLIS